MKYDKHHFRKDSVYFHIRNDVYQFTNLHILHVASYYDSLETFLFVYNFGFDPNVKSSNEFYPLHYACLGGAIEVASFLCTPEIINVKGLNFAPLNSQFTPIFLATLSKSFDILELLFENGATIPRYSTKDSPIHQAIRCKDYRCLSLLLSHTNSERLDEKNFSPIMKAISFGFPEAVKILVDHGGDLSYQTPEGKNALSYACNQKDENMVKYLLDNGINPTVRDKLGQYPIHWAATSGNVNIVKLILENGGEANVFDFRGRPPTFSAIIAGNNFDEILKILFESGCDPNAKQISNGATILNSLIIMDATPVVLSSIKVALESGADLSIVGKNKKSIYEMVKIASKPAIVKLVEDFIHEHPDVKVK